MNNILKKWGETVHEFKSETGGRFTVNNKQTATVKGFYHLELCVTQRWQPIVMDKDINFRNVMLIVFYNSRENPSARTFCSQYQRTVTVLVMGAADSDSD